MAIADWSPAHRIKELEQQLRRFTMGTQEPTLAPEPKPDEAHEEAVVEAVARSLHVVFLSAVPVIAIGFLVVLLLTERPLRESAHIGAARPEPQPELEPAAGRDHRS